MSATCETVAPSPQPLTPWQKAGLELVAFFRGRDVVLAIDLTESVGLNDEGRIRLRQIVEDSLQRGDTVYVVPFASTVFPQASVIEFRGQEKDIDRILEAIPFQTNRDLRNTDIQQAELFIYQKLAQLNQCRFAQNQPIKPQSVVWLTDAPLLTQPGIPSQVWRETPADSPFRVENSRESQQRWGWLQALPLDKRSLPITTDKNQVYKLTVVDIEPTVQEFCTPAPGGKETCLVTSYLIKQLWLPGAGLAIGLIIFIFFIQKWLSWQKKWQVIADFSSEDTEDEKICYLRNNQQIAIGEDGVNSIECPGSEVRAYLERKGNRFYLVPTGLEQIFYNGREITQRTLLSDSQIRINCPYGRNRDFEFLIRIKK